jgi:hypothetical protein
MAPAKGSSFYDGQESSGPEEWKISGSSEEIKILLPVRIKRVRGLGGAYSEPHEGSVHIDSRSYGAIYSQLNSYWQLIAAGEESLFIGVVASDTLPFTSI